MSKISIIYNKKFFVKSWTPSSIPTPKNFVSNFLNVWVKHLNTLNDLLYKGLMYCWINFIIGKIILQLDPYQVLQWVVLFYIACVRINSRLYRTRDPNLNCQCWPVEVVAYCCSTAVLWLWCFVFGHNPSALCQVGWQWSPQYNWTLAWSQMLLSAVLWVKHE